MNVVLDNLSCRIGMTEVFKGVSLELESPGLLLVTGPNGSGKSTLADCVTGFIKPSSGRVLINGIDTRKLNEEKIARLGVCRVFQGQHLSWNDSVLENINAASTLNSRGKPYGQVLDIACELGLKDLLTQKAWMLSHGQQRLLALAKAIVTTADLIVIDEVFAGLDDVSQELTKQALENQSRQRLLIVIEHSGSLHRLASKVLHLNSGSAQVLAISEQKGADNPCLALAERPQDFTSVSVESHSEQAKLGTLRSQNMGPTIRVHDLTVRYDQHVVLTKFSLSVLSGEVVAVCGPNGSGKSTLLKAISGVVAPDSGSIHFGPSDITAWSVERRSKHGICSIPQDGRVFRSLSIKENILLYGLSLPKKSRDRKLQRLQYYLVEWDIIRDMRRLAGTLSGGEQTKLSLCKPLLCNSQLILLDEPGAGLDERSIQSVEKLIKLWSRKGIAVIIAEHNADFVSRVATKIITMDSAGT